MEKQLLKNVWLRVCMLIAVIGLSAVQAYGEEASFEPSNFSGQGTSGTGSAISATVNDVTFACDKGYGTTQIRCYSGAKITISSTKTITSIGFTFSGDYKGGLETQYTGLSTTSWEKTLTSQARFTKITVTYAADGSTVETVVTPTFTPEAGAYTSAQEVTISCETEDATIYYTTDGTNPTAESASYDGAINVSATTTIKAIAMKEGMNSSAIASATYVITEHAGTEADPYSVADAIAILSANPTSTYENVYVSGIISQIDSYISSYKSITYWISDDGTTENQFEVYSGKGLDGADFSSIDDLIVGSQVVLNGNIKKYNTTTFEFDKSSVIISLKAPTYPIINAGTSLELDYTATAGSIEYSITNPVDGVTLSATTTADWISNISVGENVVSFDATENEGTADRTATITLSYEGAESVDVTVTQKHYVSDVATLPFEFDGGKSDIAETAGLSQDGLSTDYASTPKLKFDSTNDYVILKFNERPGKLTFDIKGNSFSGGTFKVQTSEDGETYTDLESYTELSSTLSESFSNLGENVRYIKWIYTERSSGNVALGNIKLEKYSESTEQGYTVTIGSLTNVTSVELWDGDMNDITDGDEVAAGTLVYAKPNVADGYTLESITAVDADNNEVTLTENSGSWSFTMPESNVTISATAVEGGEEPSSDSYYKKVTSTENLVDGEYLIVYEDGAVAFNGGLETLDAVGNTIAVTISDATIVSSDAVDAAIFTIATSSDSYTIKSASGYYIGNESDANALKSSDSKTYANTISFDDDGNANIVSSGSYLRYNSASNQTRFRYYKSASYTGQKAIALYKKVSEEPAGDTEAYAIVSTDNTSVTFYYDANKSTREGTIVEIKDGDENEYQNWVGSDLTTATFDDSFAEYDGLKKTSMFFNNCQNLTTINGLTNLNTSNVTVMSQMFNGCGSLTALDLSNFDTSSVTADGGLGTMFANCKSLTSLDLSNFDTGNVKNMNQMFYGCTKLESIIFGENFKTDNCVGMWNMFANCTSLTELDLSGFNTANVTHMANMFAGSSSLKTIYVGDDWSTANVVAEQYQQNGQFNGCTALVGGNGTAYDASHIDIDYAIVDGQNGQPGYLTHKNMKYVTISDAGYATLYLGSAVTIPEGVTVSYVSGYSGKALTLTPITGTIPANTGVILKAEAGTYAFAYTTDVDAITGNYLYGSVTSAETNAGDGSYLYYKLANDRSKGIGFYWGAENGAAFTSAANKAYLAIPAGLGAKISGFALNDSDDATAITAVEDETITNNKVYDLTGREVKNPAKGVYIINGKKMFVK